MNERPLRDEVAAFIGRNGPQTTEDVAIGIRARRADVAAVLAGEGFYRCAAPEGTNPRAVFFNVSQHVPRAQRRTDCDYLHAILSDGREHSLDEILARSQRERGHGFTVHSRAAELRKKRGLTIVQRSEHRNGRVLSFYRMAVAVSLEPAASSNRPEQMNPSRGSSSGASTEVTTGMDGETAGPSEIGALFTDQATRLGAYDEAA